MASLGTHPIPEPSGHARGRQLALPFPHAPDLAVAAFLEAGSNAAARTWLARTETWPGGRLVLWGRPGSGKTHLLRRWARMRGAWVLSGPCLRGLPPAPLQLMAIDDADAAAEEPALLHVLNAAAEAGLPVLLAARAPPARWATDLPDLASRVRAAATVEIGAAEDSLLRALLARLLADRQLAVAENVQDWLLLHLPREPAALREAVARLDRAALAAGARITRPFAAQALAPLLADAEACDISAMPSPGGSLPDPVLL